MGRSSCYIPVNRQVDAPAMDDFRISGGAGTIFTLTRRRMTVLFRRGRWQVTSSHDVKFVHDWEHFFSHG